ncbi:MAG: sugar phosphate isomerase/epimerase family protein, partial [Acidimicrobiales bacterium]
PDARSLGITLVLENHYKDGYWEWPELAQSAQAFLKLLEGIPESAWFGVNFDPSNAVVAGEDPLELLDSVKERVVTMHASDRYLKDGTAEDLRRREADPQTGYSQLLHHGVIGDGLNDFDAIFHLLRSVDFQGWISIEDGDDPTQGADHLRRSAAFLRTKMTLHGLP